MAVYIFEAYSQYLCKMRLEYTVEANLLADVHAWLDRQPLAEVKLFITSGVESREIDKV